MINIIDTSSTLNRLTELKKNLTYLDSQDDGSVIRIGKMAFITPLSITPIAYKISKKGLSYNYQGENRSYLETVFFPEGITDSRMILSYSNRTYIPILCVHTASLGPQELTNQLNQLHSIFLQLIRTNVIADPEFIQLITDQTIGFVVSEIFDNIEQHAKASNMFIFAQYWRSNHTCEICILDDGIGIYHSLKKAGRAVQSSFDAIKQVIESGMSSKIKFVDSIRGTGVKNVRAALANRELNGEFMIVSGNAGFLHGASFGEKLLNFAEYSWNGTIVMMRFSKPTTPFNLYKYVK